jgi:hypothetical protein
LRQSRDTLTKPRVAKGQRINGEQELTGCGWWPFTIEEG